MVVCSLPYNNLRLLFDLEETTANEGSDLCDRCSGKETSGAVYKSKIESALWKVLNCFERYRPGTK